MYAWALCKILSYLQDSSDGWIANSKELNIPYQLVENGFDVWIGNNRGNFHSNKHTSLDKKKNKNDFWNFTYHQMGMKDVPAMTDYILGLTKKEKLTYIGHSRGCAQFFVLCSLNPNYCKEKFNGFVALAPAVFIGKTKSGLSKTGLTMLAGMMNFFKMGNKGMFDDQSKTALIGKMVNFNGTNFPGGQEFSLRFISDTKKSKNNSERMAVYFSKYPNPSSTKDIKLFDKMFKTDEFKNYEDENNVQDYPLKSFNVKTYIKVGKEDMLVPPEGGQKLRSSLNDNIIMEYKEYDNMGHISFFMHDGSSTYLQDVINDVKKINE